MQQIRRRRKTNGDAENRQNDDILDIKVKVRIGSRIIEEDVNEALYIPTVDKLNPTAISNMMAGIPALHARWNFLYNEAVFEYDILKTKLDVWLARKAREFRKELEKLKDKGRVTEGMVNEALRMDPEYKKINDELAEAKKNMKHILAIANGFGEKGDKIISIASMMKWEGEVLNKTNRARPDDKTYQHIQKESEEIEGRKDISVNDGWPT